VVINGGPGATSRFTSRGLAGGAKRTETEKEKVMNVPRGGAWGRRALLWFALFATPPSPPPAHALGPRLHQAARPGDTVLQAPTGTTTTPTTTNTPGVTNTPGTTTTPTPSPKHAPEPGTLTLAALGAGLFGARWLRRRRAAAEAT